MLCLPLAAEIRTTYDVLTLRLDTYLLVHDLLAGSLLISLRTVIHLRVCARARQ